MSYHRGEWRPMAAAEAEEQSLLTEILRLAFAWAAMAGIVWFWYWLLSNLGTF
jgi:hypothetical protein